MDDTILTTAHKVATDESVDAICKVFPIGPRMPIPYRARWWGKRLENVSSLFPKGNRNLNENHRF